jgi:uncharacterized protein (DUF433 family)
MNMTDTPSINEGIYSVDEAAELISKAHNISRRRIDLWLKHASTFGVHGAAEEGTFLTFLDLVSLEVVARFRTRLSGQQVRNLEGVLRTEYPDLDHPFAAVGLFYTDGKAVWASMDPDGHSMTEIIGKRFRHGVMAPMIKPFITEIQVKRPNPMATAWYLSDWVEVNPRIQFGRPVVSGTRVPVATVLSNLQVGSAAEVADWYGLTVEQVEGVQAFAAAA